MGLDIDLIHVKIDNVRSNLFVEVFKPLVPHNENSVESRKDRRLEVDLFRSVLQVVIAAVEWVCCGKH